MSLLRKLIRSNGVLLHSLKPNQGGGSQFPRQSTTHHFSTQSEQQQQQQQRLNQDSAVDPILRQPPREGSIYAKLYGIGMFTTKNDVISYLESCNLSSEDIKVQYNGLFLPVSMVLQFPSHSAYENAVSIIRRKSRVYHHKIEKVAPAHWGFDSYDGKAVLIQGVPRNAISEDIERMLSGCDFNSSSLRFIWRQNFSDSMKFAMVQFPSKVDAMNAVLEKNGSFCLNTQISMRVLH
ncbi:hypothetical protein C5167_046648 [Papaver somniferum]|uniref:Uncharacterized protein n=1 Tax=Papaver somniferum TaxID=3469 RepID=A0A4Y7LEE2_PAPSO|nr:uncharacterized protein LOC113323188 [Papaver somniferum]RZC83863.1 hypothetical protein C5167_046648 [Papaver somniferum]